MCLSFNKLDNSLFLKLNQKDSKFYTNINNERL